MVHMKFILTENLKEIISLSHTSSIIINDYKQKYEITAYVTNSELGRVIKTLSTKKEAEDYLAQLFASLNE